MKLEKQILLDVFEAAYVSLKRLKPILNSRGIYEISATELAMKELKNFTTSNPSVPVHDFIRTLKKLLGEGTGANRERKKEGKPV
jgi:hypothetical protein